ncbi:hypothetical protein IAD21_05053 [Abditibacteriota bacterium]|nr:hypothetical protein IAD21_05053 [Abditibacteriota bacterium]
MQSFYLIVGKALCPLSFSWAQASMGQSPSQQPRRKEIHWTAKCSIPSFYPAGPVVI